MTAAILRTLLLVLILVSPAWGEEIPHAPSTLEVVVGGEARTLDAQRQARIKFWLQQLMLSALFQDLVTEASPAEWDEMRQVPKRIYCRYASSATLAIPERPVLVFDEVLLPWHPAEALHWIFIKKDDQIGRLVFWDPWVYKQLITAAEFPAHPRFQHVQRGDW